MSKLLLTNLFFVILFSFLVSVVYWKTATPQAITFSDSAKMADAARSFLINGQFETTHSFYSKGNIENFIEGKGWNIGSQFLPAFMMATVFKYFPINDTTVFFLGSSFFILSALLVFIVAQKSDRILTGWFSVILFCFNPYFLEYGVNASSEIFFIFLILLSVVFWICKGWLKSLTLFPILLMFITRPQAIIYLGSFIVAVSIEKIMNLEIKRKMFLVLITLGILLNWGKIYPILSRNPYLPFYHMGSFNILSSVNPGIYLRGIKIEQAIPLKDSLSKVFYNFYNFLKLPERIAPIGILIFLPFIFSKRRLFVVKISGLSLVTFLFFASATLPNARYVHPVVPLIIIATSIGLVELTKDKKWLGFVIIGFIIFPMLGNLTLDARFRRNQYNYGKPPVYKEISRVASERILAGKLVITNLDAWGAWYNKISTVWFPVEPNLLSEVNKSPDYILLTDYKSEDGDFSLGVWKDILDQNDTQNKFIRDNYQVIDKFQIKKSDVYENKDYKGVLLKKHD